VTRDCPVLAQTYSIRSHDRKLEDTLSGPSVPTERSHSHHHSSPPSLSPGKGVTSPTEPSLLPLVQGPFDLTSSLPNAGPYCSGAASWASNINHCGTRLISASYLRRPTESPTCSVGFVPPSRVSRSFSSCYEDTVLSIPCSVGSATCCRWSRGRRTCAGRVCEEN
jgi:hypothetical protein